MLIQCYAEKVPTKIGIIFKEREISMIETKTIQIVLIEDYKLTRIGLRSTLNEYDGINIAGESENAEEGLKIIKEIKPDVVLMDLGLPDMNGIEATQQIKAFDENIKVIILTSHDRNEEVLAALGSGARAYCLKDIEPDILVNIIRDVNNGAFWLDPAIAEIALKLFPKPESGRDYNLSASVDVKSKLSEREYEVLGLVVKGRSNTEIAKELFISVHTAKAHVCSILQKFCVDDRVQAAVKAVTENMV